MYADNGADSRGVNKVLHCLAASLSYFNYVPLNISWDKTETHKVSQRSARPHMY